MNIQVRNKNTGAEVTKTLKNWKHLPSHEKEKYELIDNGDISHIPTGLFKKPHDAAPTLTPPEASKPDENPTAPEEPIETKIAEEYSTLTGSFNTRCNILKTRHGLHYNTIKKYLKDAGIEE